VNTKQFVVPLHRRLV